MFMDMMKRLGSGTILSADLCETNLAGLNEAEFEASERRLTQFIKTRASRPHLAVEMKVDIV
jgi:hypothetical protein